MNKQFTEFRQRVDAAMDRLFAVDYQTLLGNAPSLDRDLGWLSHAFKTDVAPDIFAADFGRIYHFTVVPGDAAGPVRDRIGQHNMDMAGLFEFGNDPECVWFAGTDGAAYSRSGDVTWKIALRLTGRNAPFVVSRQTGGTPISFAFDPRDSANRIEVPADAVFEQVAIGHDVDLAIDAAVAAYTRSLQVEDHDRVTVTAGDSDDSAPTVG